MSPPSPLVQRLHVAGSKRENWHATVVLQEFFCDTFFDIATNA